MAGSRQEAVLIDQAIDELQGLTLGRAHAAKTGVPFDSGLQISMQEIKIEQLLTDVRGQAAQTIYEARADRWERAISERAKAGRFAAELLAYRGAPNYYRAKRYLDTLAHGLIHARKYILASDEAQLPIFRIDLKDARSTIDSILQDDD